MHPHCLRAVTVSGQSSMDTAERRRVVKTINGHGGENVKRLDPVRVARRQSVVVGIFLAAEAKHPEIGQTKKRVPWPSVSNTAPIVRLRWIDPDLADLALTGTGTAEIG